MPTPQQLLHRLDDIANAVAATGDGLALLGLGSVGQDTARLDAYSDLDFFVIVRPGRKERFLSDLDWLEAAAPLAFTFQNTVDGHKALFEDGIFCEMAVFEPDELAQIPYTAARVVWQDPDSDLAIPSQNLLIAPQPAPETDWLLNEALTNLLVGLLRWQRGEKLSAARLIQGHAVDRVLALAARLEATQGAQGDPFAAERRFEGRYPQTAVHLPAFMPGYEHSPQAAQAILAYLDQHFTVHPALRQAILAAC